MTVVKAILELRRDLDRTIQALEAMRHSFISFVAGVPDLEQPGKIAPVKRDPRLQEFLSKHCHASKSGYVKSSELFRAYAHWCRTEKQVRMGQRYFALRLRALGYRYSRSRRIRGCQTRTWEGITLRKKAA